MEMLSKYINIIEGNYNITNFRRYDRDSKYLILMSSKDGMHSTREFFRNFTGYVTNTTNIYHTEKYITTYMVEFYLRGYINIQQLDEMLGKISLSLQGYIDYLLDIVTERLNGLNITFQHIYDNKLRIFKWKRIAIFNHKRINFGYMYDLKKRQFYSKSGRLKVYVGRYYKTNDSRIIIPNNSSIESYRIDYIDILTNKPINGLFKIIGEVDENSIDIDRMKKLKQTSPNLLTNIIKSL